MSRIDEIGPDIFRISTYVPAADLQFNQFLIRDDQPLLYHTGQKTLFPEVLAAVGSLIKVDDLRWIGFSHFESDECGSLNRWYGHAPQAQALAGQLAARTCISDFSDRAPRVLDDDEKLVLGRHTLRFLATPYVPHSWEASLLFDETEKVLFCSDLLLQRGDPQAAFDPDILEHAMKCLGSGQTGLFRDPIPYMRTSATTFARLAALCPETLATMHGASFRGDCSLMLHDYDYELSRLLAPNLRG